MKKVHFLHTIALLSLSLTGRSYCAAENSAQEAQALGWGEWAYQSLPALSSWIPWGSGEAPAEATPSSAAQMGGQRPAGSAALNTGLSRPRPPVTTQDESDEYESNRQAAIHAAALTSRMREIDKIHEFNLKQADKENQESIARQAQQEEELAQSPAQEKQDAALPVARAMYMGKKQTPRPAGPPPAHAGWAVQARPAGPAPVDAE